MTITTTDRLVLTGFAALLLSTPSTATAQATPGPIASKTTGFERRDGFLPVYVDAKADSVAAPEVRAIVELKLAELRTLARGRGAVGGVDERAHWTAIARDIDRWIENRELPRLTPALVAPPGDPFGIPET